MSGAKDITEHGKAMKKYFCLLIIALLVSSCEKPLVIGEMDDERTEGGTIVKLHFSPYSLEDFSTRAEQALIDQCTRLSVAVFKLDGTKVKSINQKQGDTNFGTVSMSLTEGAYKVVAIAHSSTEGNATISSIEKVTFASNKMTDTFSYCGTLNVGDEPIEDDISLKRVVAMVRLTFSENIPNNVQRLKFYYTGGSSTLNPSTGYGCVNSKQTEYRYTHNDDDISINTYEIYTAPHEQNDVLKLTITALDSDGISINEWTMDDVPVTKNKITTWTGSLFGGGSGGGSGGTSSGGMSILVDTEWTGVINYNY